MSVSARGDLDVDPDLSAHLMNPARQSRPQSRTKNSMESVFVDGSEEIRIVFVDMYGAVQCLAMDVCVIVNRHPPAPQVRWNTESASLSWTGLYWKVASSAAATLDVESDPRSDLPSGADRAHRTNQQSTRTRGSRVNTTRARKNITQDRMKPPCASRTGTCETHPRQRTPPACAAHLTSQIYPYQTRFRQS